MDNLIDYSNLIKRILSESEELLEQETKVLAEIEEARKAYQKGNYQTIQEYIASRPKFGSAKGLVEMSDNFDEPLEDFKLYAP